MRYKLFYILFVVSAVLYANSRLFVGLTPRNLMSIVMFFICLSEERRIFLDKWFRIYLVFILGFGISSIVTGYVDRFPRFLIGFYFVAYVSYWATSILMKKYNGIEVLINTIVCIGIVDAVITIGQFYYIPSLVVFPSLIGLKIDEDFLTNVDLGDAAYGLTLPGIMQTDVYNGYFLMVVGILSLYYIRNGFKLSRAWRFLPWIIALVSSYMVQQRSPFYLLLFASAYTFFKMLNMGKSRFKFLYILLFLFVIPYILNVLFDILLSGESRFNMGMEGNRRISIYSRAINYINDNLLFGGIFKLFDTEGFAPHNLFLNAWIYGGILGFVVIIKLTWDQLLPIMRILWKRLNPYLFDVFIIGLAFLCFTMNSMLHNVSVVTGDIIIWMLWGCFISYFKRKCVNNYSQ